MNHFPFAKRFAIAAVICMLLLSSFLQTASALTHTVEIGENLEKIAVMYGVTVNEIVEANIIKNKNVIEIGRELTIPDSASAQNNQQLAQTETNATDTDTTVSNQPDASQVPTAAAGSGSTSQSKTEISFGAQASKISLNIINADIRDVLSAVALNMGTNIIYKGDPVNLSIKLDNVTMDQAIEYITKTAGLSYIHDGSILIVGSREGLSADFGDNVEVCEFSLRYITAETLSNQIEELGLSVISLKIDSNNKTIWVQGFASDLIKIKQITRMLDSNDNIELGSAEIKNNFRAISVEYISAEEFKTILEALSLPSGFTLNSNKSVLYVYASIDDFKSIETIRVIVDVIENYSMEGAYSQSGNFQTVQLNYVPKEKAKALIDEMGIDVKIITSERMQKAIWISGSIDAILQAKEVLATIDISSAGIGGSFDSFRLYNVTAEEMEKKLALLQIPEISVYTFAYPAFSKSILVKCSGDYVDNISEIIYSLDQVTPTVMLPIDSSDVEDGASRLQARRKLISELSGIDIIKFKISGNVAKDEGFRFVLYLADSPEEIQRVKNIIAEIDGV